MVGRRGGRQVEGAGPSAPHRPGRKLTNRLRWMDGSGAPVGEPRGGWGVSFFFYHENRRAVRQAS